MRLFVVTGIAVLAAAVLATATSVRAASSSVVVSATIPSAVTLTNGCVGVPATQFGTVLAGSAVVTATGAGRCTVAWDSSNDSSSLRIGQRDGTGSAMGRAGTGGASNDLSGFRGVDTEDGSSLLAVGTAARSRRRPTAA